MIGSYNVAADVGVAIACSLQGGGGMKERPAGNRASREGESLTLQVNKYL